MPSPLPADVELLISGGTLVDGTGAAAGPGTLGDPRRRGCTSADEAWQPQAARTIDATGLVVAPGFIDLHSHGGLVILADPRHEPKVRQGVTTEIIGVDGNWLRAVPRIEPTSHALRRAERRPGRRPGRSTTTGTPSRRYLDRFDAARPSTSGSWSATARCGSRASAGRTSPPTSAATGRHARDAARGDGGGRLRHLSRAWTIRRAPTPRPTSWRR